MLWFHYMKFWKGKGNLGVKNQNSCCLWGLGHKLTGKGHKEIFWGDDGVIDFDNYLGYPVQCVFFFLNSGVHFQDFHILLCRHGKNVSKHWNLGNNIHAELFRGMYSDIYNLLWNAPNIGGINGWREDNYVNVWWSK